eukprot:8259008-Ditylum_brightwellii.AAC.1
MTNNLTEELAHWHQDEDSQLSWIKRQNISSQWNKKVSGYKVYNAITRIANTSLSTNEVEQILRDWLNMERLQTESIKDWSTRVQNAAQELGKTSITIAQSDIGRRWRTGLGTEFEEFNKMIYITSQIPVG